MLVYSSYKKDGKTLWSLLIPEKSLKYLNSLYTALIYQGYRFFCGIQLPQITVFLGFARGEHIKVRELEGSVGAE